MCAVRPANSGDIDPKIACVLLASGCSARFGANKLLQYWFGRPVYMYVFDAMPTELLSDIIVVSAYERILEEGRRRGFTVVYNDSPDLGTARTISLGLEAVSSADACMFCVCDQPALQQSSLRTLVQSYAGGIRALSFRGQRGNPVIFPHALFEELRQLQGDQGGAAVIRNHPDLVELCECRCIRELTDVDTPAQLQSLTTVTNLFVVEDEATGSMTVSRLEKDIAEIVRDLGTACRARKTSLLHGKERIVTDQYAAESVLGICLDDAAMDDVQYRMQIIELLESSVPLVGVVRECGSWQDLLRSRLDTILVSPANAVDLKSAMMQFTRQLRPWGPISADKNS